MNTNTTRREAVIAALAVLAARPVGAQTLAPPSKAVVASIAPSGRLLAAFNAGNPVLAVRNLATGEVTGVTVDIANELGRRLGVPVDLKVYTDGNQLMPGLAADHWNIALLALDPNRAGELAFTAPYLLLEGTYLVREAAPYRSAVELDREGLIISAGAGSAYDMALTRGLKHASIARAANTPAANAAVLNGDQYAALAGVRQMLANTARANPGHRILPDAFGTIEQGIGIPHGHEVGQRYLTDFVETLKRSGFIRASLDRHGQTDAIVAPSRP